MLDILSGIVPFLKEINKADNILKGTYFRILLVTTYELISLSIIIIGLGYTVLHLPEAHRYLTMMEYADRPHTLESIHTWDFLLSDWYRYVAIWIIYELTKSIIGRISYVAGGYTIPSKP